MFLQGPSEIWSFVGAVIGFGKGLRNGMRIYSVAPDFSKTLDSSERSGVFPIIGTRALLGRPDCHGLVSLKAFVRSGERSFLKLKSGAGF
jgi:hypothetical protein